VSPSFLGTSTGSALFGAFGIGVEVADLSKDDHLTALDNSLQIPPNNVLVAVSGLVIGEDYLMSGPKAAGNDFDFDWRTLSTTLSTGSETSVVVTVAIPADIPQAGTLRIELDSGISRRVAYTSWTGSTFTIGSTDFSTDNATAGNDVMVTYHDKLAAATTENVTVKYSEDRTWFLRVRDGGASPTKTFESPISVGSGGGSVSVIRTSDA
jgi:hypothetical protein